MGGDVLEGFGGEELVPLCWGDEEEGFELAVQHAVGVEIDMIGGGLLEHEDTQGKHDGEDDAHGGAGFDFAQAFDEFDEADGDEGGCSGAQEHDGW